MMTKRFALPDTLPDPYFTIDAGEAQVTIKICRTEKGMMAELWRENKILCRVLAATIDINDQPREEHMAEAIVSIDLATYTTIKRLLEELEEFKKKWPGDYIGAHRVHVQGGTHPRTAPLRILASKQHT